MRQGYCLWCDFRDHCSKRDSGGDRGSRDRWRSEPGIAPCFSSNRKNRKFCTKGIGKIRKGISYVVWEKYCIGSDRKYCCL